VARFLLQEFGGRAWKPFGRTDWMPGTLISSFLVVFAWGFFIWTGSISTIWPMFGCANQLLATVALAVSTTALVNAGKARYAWVTAVPLAFMTVTTLAAGWLNITDNFIPLAQKVPEKSFMAWLNAALTAVMMACAVLILVECGRRWWRVLGSGRRVRERLYGTAGDASGRRNRASDDLPDLED
jgi:carbon starvation protein